MAGGAESGGDAESSKPMTPEQCEDLFKSLMLLIVNTVNAVVCGIIGNVLNLSMLHTYLLASPVAIISCVVYMIVLVKGCKTLSFHFFALFIAAVMAAAQVFIMWC